MNLRKNKTLITVVVIIVAVGLVMTYVPLLFAPPAEPINSQQENDYFYNQQETADLNAKVVSPESTTSTSNNSLPESFGGLEEESRSLDGVLKDVNQ